MKPYLRFLFLFVGFLSAWIALSIIPTSVPEGVIFGERARLQIWWLLLIVVSSICLALGFGVEESREQDTGKADSE